MAKKLTRGKLVKKLDAIFSQYIRRKNSEGEYGTCFTCNKQDEWKRLQNGHFQSRRHYSTRWDDINCQIQCPKCNVFNYGEQFLFAQKLDAKFGVGTARRLHIKAQQTVKYSDSDIEEMIIKYKSFVDLM